MKIRKTVTLVSNITEDKKRKFGQWRIFNKDKTNLIFLLILVLAVVVIMLPLREQTAGDDYVYALSVKHSIESGHLQVSEATAAALVFLVAWGAIFTKIFGFSLKTLQFSVIVLLPILTLAIYFLLRELKIEKNKSFFFTILFISIPFIFQYTYTFLTDMPYLTLEVLAIVFFIKAFKKISLLNFFLGSFFSCLAFLTRQIGIFIWVSALLTYLVFLTKHDRRFFSLDTIKYPLLMCLPVVVTVIIYFIFFSEPTISQNRFYQSVVLKNISSLFYIHTSPALMIGAWLGLFYRVIEWFWLALGLFSPLAIIFLASNPREYMRAKLIKKTILSLVIFAILIIIESILFPGKVYLGFPLILYRYESLFPIPWPHIWKYLVLLSFLFLGTCVTVSKKPIAKVYKLFKINKIFFFLFLSYLLILVSTAFAAMYYNKYVLPLLPFYLLLFALVSRKIKINIPVAIFVTAFIFIDSLQMAKLRYDENGLAQTKAIEIKNQGISAERILPNLEYTWSLWFDMDTNFAEELKRVNGDKKRAKIPITPANQDYIIISKEHLKYYKLPTNYQIIEKIPLKSLFVSTYLLVIRKY